MQATRADIIERLSRSMQELYPTLERRQIARIVAAAISGEAESKFLIDPAEVIEVDDSKMEYYVEQLSSGRPLQYILGRSLFCGIEIGVREGVLIPRPETEELVEWAVDIARSMASSNPAPRIADICSGSGCIAIALAKMIKGSKVTAVELSTEAIAIASENCQRAGAEVEIIKDDALSGLKSLEGREYEIIVSNPPYIPRRERSIMRSNVTDFEPDMALFVGDDDPLIFYRGIAQAAKRLLRWGGYLLFEVHEHLAQECGQMLRDMGFAEVDIRLDMFDKERMICCRNEQI